MWASKAVERSRAVTVRLSVVTRVGRRHFLSDAAMAMREQDEAKVGGAGRQAEVLTD